MLRDFTDTDTVAEKDRQFRKELEHARVLDLYMNINVSAGYTYGIANNSDEIKSMIRLADHNLYQVKKNGRKDICGSPFQPNFLNMSKKKQRESLICFHAVFFVAGNGRQRSGQP
ncbi:hypothetical protein LOB71_09995 [Lactobacillus delbrueckii subsp. lactis]|nr:hypothetical protein [Lactobacillus delbrueckii]MCD5512994.1 hypothetical protein [Lactobacillus delbrueckii subsp. lactis]MCD5530386.1 hypothetical protein [Lactobacillus delbrueckii subsp. lactis]MCD5549284.1 hypothetical protein [Lactobacillus delbrueckii subsp. lactis]MCD5554711.1 hypothetical protein [Lactobacillus delbrueckii subsp. lactis]MCD5560550.1 hypothetical protein [Lactobacillus delbrueckii subsp. lactis]